MERIGPIHTWKSPSRGIPSRAFQCHEGSEYGVLLLVPYLPLGTSTLLHNWMNPQLRVRVGVALVHTRSTCRVHTSTRSTWYADSAQPAVAPMPPAPCQRPGECSLGSCGARKPAQGPSSLAGSPYHRGWSLQTWSFRHGIQMYPSKYSPRSTP